MSGHRPTLIDVRGDVQESHPERWTDSPPPQASVVVAIHNAEKYVTRLLEQLRALDHPSFEVILVDDGSTDSTLDIVGEISSFPVPILVLRVQRNIGVAMARNLALRYIAGSYVWMVDGDDRWPVNALLALTEAAQRTESDMVIAQATRVIEGSDRTSRIPAPTTAGILDNDEVITAYLRGELQGQLWNKLFVRELLVGHGAIFPPMPSKSDVCGLVPLLSRVRRAVVISDDVYTYEFHSGSIATSKAKPLDLLRVAEVSYRQFGNRGIDRSILDLFWIRSIAMPLLTEVWRFDDRSASGQYALRVISSGLGLRVAIRLVRIRQFRAAALSVALRYARGVVRGLYVRARAAEWTD